MKNTNVSSEKRKAPLTILFGSLLYAVGEVGNHVQNPFGLLFSVIGFVLVLYGVFYVHLADNADDSPYSFRAVVYAFSNSLLAGILAYLIAIGDREYWIIIAQLFAMFSIACTAAAGLILFNIGVKYDWWLNKQGQLLWAFPLTFIALWLGIAAFGALMLNSPVPLFWVNGEFLFSIRWWSGLLVPASLGYRWLNNKFQKK